MFLFRIFELTRYFKIVGFADNRFSNGGDIFLVDWIYNISDPYDELVSIAHKKHFLTIILGEHQPTLLRWMEHRRKQVRNSHFQRYYPPIVWPVPTKSPLPVVQVPKTNCYFV